MDEELKLKKEQNALLAEVAYAVKENKESNEELTEQLSEKVDSAVRSMQTLTETQREFEKNVAGDIRHEMSLVSLQMKSEAKDCFSKGVNEEKWKLQQLYKEYEEKTRDTLNRFERIEKKLEITSGWKTFFFWATPVLMFFQTILLFYVLFLK